MNSTKGKENPVVPASAGPKILLSLVLAGKRYLLALQTCVVPNRLQRQMPFWYSGEQTEAFSFATCAPLLREFLRLQSTFSELNPCGVLTTCICILIQIGIGCATFYQIFFNNINRFVLQNLSTLFWQSQARPSQKNRLLCIKIAKVLRLL